MKSLEAKQRLLRFTGLLCFSYGLDQVLESILTQTRQSFAFRSQPYNLTRAGVQWLTRSSAVSLKTSMSKCDWVSLTRRFLARIATDYAATTISLSPAHATFHQVLEVDGLLPELFAQQNDRQRMGDFPCDKLQAGDLKGGRSSPRGLVCRSTSNSKSSSSDPKPGIICSRQTRKNMIISARPLPGLLGRLRGPCTCRPSRISA